MHTTAVLFFLAETICFLFYGGLDHYSLYLRCSYWILSGTYGIGMGTYEQEMVPALNSKCTGMNRQYS